jgi:Zn-dependent protease with chaperone function
VVLAPVSLGVRLALARWHRAADLSADRAGLLCCTDVGAAGQAMLRVALGASPAVDPEAYVEQIRRSKLDSGPSSWAEILASNPWAHKRIQALDLFARSEVYAAHTGVAPEGPLLDKAELDRQTSAILGVV